MKEKLLKQLKNKYKLSILILFFWVTFFTSHDLISHISNRITLSDLEKEKSDLNSEIKKDQEKLKELSTNPENLEKFAREEYLMKKEGEVVFVVIKEEE